MNIVNVVSTANVGKSINLSTLEGVKYNPHKFGAAIKKLDSCTALIWKTGKIVVVGAHSEEVALQGCNIIAHMLGGDLSQFKIQNVVGSRDVDFGINLTSFYNSNRRNSVWEPELFPGLTYRIKGCVVNIFTSGKIVITGAKSERDVDEIFDIVYPKILKNKK
jgi:transcription initiation factor TFIID TATA-box-binding protein